MKMKLIFRNYTYWKKSKLQEKYIAKVKDNNNEDKNVEMNVLKLH